MARAATKGKAAETTNQRGHWQEQIAKAVRRYTPFWNAGKIIVDRYRLERSQADQQVDLYKDRFNLLYSSTETIKPSLYATTPKVEATRRHPDRENETVLYAVQLLETSTQYAMEEIDFDEVMNNCVEDFLLPGLGQTWVRYEPTFKKAGANDNGATEDGYSNELEDEKVCVDYVHYCDFITGPGRTWAELPWVARRVYFTRDKAKKRFGTEKANQMAYSYNNRSNALDIDSGTGEEQAVVWEIWDKASRDAIWYSDDYGPDLLDRKSDPLKLKNFFPCPRPIRAISNTRTMVPKGLYSQYKAQAEQIDLLTERIRVLTDALKLVGVYDGSQDQLQNLLRGNVNKLVAIQNWAQFAATGGINGAIQWVPIKEVATVLSEMLRQREIAKNEVYEITGFSDIVRGSTKASETLGAQQIKADWATGRLRTMQKEVQRFARDTIRLMSEIISEHFQPATLLLYAGIDIPEPTPEEQAAAAQAVAQGMPAPPTAAQQVMEQFKKVLQLLRREKQRCALIGIETDSTILPDEAKERQDRIQFLGQMGAFLQQAGPMAAQYPDMRALLGGMMMFVVRTFPASRPLEKLFDDFQKKFAQTPAAPPPGQGGEQKPDPTAAAQATAQGKMQETQMKEQGEAQRQQLDLQMEKYKVDAQEATKREKQQQDHEYRMMQLRLEEAKLQQAAVQGAAEVKLKAGQAEHQEALAESDQAHRHEMDAQGAAEGQYQFDRGQEAQDADREAQRAAKAKTD